jgi:Antibiotic biosynthesis monooxygenase
MKIRSQRSTTPVLLVPSEDILTRALLRGYLALCPALLEKEDSLANAGREGQQMEKTGQSYSSGDWLVQAGSEDEFIERWTTFIEWSLSNAEGAESFVLVRSTEDPRKFLSLGGEPRGDGGMARDAQDARVVWPVPGVVRGVRVPPVHPGG